MTNKKIAIITASPCDIPMELREKYGITVVPLTINWDGKSYLDGVDLSPEEFYAQLGQNPVRPTTSQPAPSAFLDAYEKARQKGAEEIVVVTISSAMSGTLQSARTASAGFNLPVHLVDARGNSMGLGWQVLAAARTRDAGGMCLPFWMPLKRFVRTCTFTWFWILWIFYSKADASRARPGF
jgi:DegV family protein with EDD domain